MILGVNRKRQAKSDGIQHSLRAIGWGALPASAAAGFCRRFGSVGRQRFCELPQALVDLFKGPRAPLRKAV